MKDLFLLQKNNVDLTLMELNNPNTIRAWCMYDWANSVYNLVINTAIFPIYYTMVTSSPDNSDIVEFMGFEIVNSVLYTYALSFSYLVSSIILPVLSGIADYTGNKKVFLKIFTSIGAIACMGMFFFTSSNLEWGIACVVFASLGYSSSLVFYDAFLPEIATRNMMDRISAKGYSFGYAGSVLMLIVSLVLITFWEPLGFISKGLATRTVFLLVGIWWIGFALITFRRLKDTQQKSNKSGKILLNGYRELKNVFIALKGLGNMKRYLTSFFFFNMGTQTIMLLATLFGKKELDLGASELIPIILIIQLVAIAGSNLFARLSDLKGNIFSLILMILIWIGICIYSFFMTSVVHFYIVALIVGLVMGGIQALARATFSKLIPADSEDNASFFSFFDVTFHISVVIGTFSYGLIEQVTGSMRYSALCLGVFFLLGLVLLYKVKIPNEAGRSKVAG